MFWIFWKHYMTGNKVAYDRVPGNYRSEGISASSFYPELSPEYAGLYQSIASCGKDMIAVLDERLDCSYLSRNWETITGLSLHESLEGHFKHFVPTEYHASILAYFNNSTAQDNGLHFKIIHKDGKLHWCNLNIIHATDADPTALRRYICLLHNVNELVNTQSTLEKALFEADIAKKSRSEFLANMSHELRTPLNAIIGFAQMIESGVYGDIGHPRYNDYIGNIQKSGLTLLSKINDLLEIANINSGHIQLNEAEYDLIPVIKKAMEFHSHRAFSAQIHLQDCLPVTPVRVYIDRIRILQVLNNVISNAIKHTSAGGMVDIYYERRKCGGINIVVEDNGSGISSNHLHNIITAFKADNSFFARNRNCVGLGLAISQEIVKLHQGKIDIESESGKGTILRIALPKERNVRQAAGKKTKPFKQAFEEL